MNKDINEILDIMKTIQDCIIEYLDNDNSCDVDAFQEILDNIDNFQIHDDFDMIESFLRLLLKISNNHHRSTDFFNKIEKILLLFKNDFSNFTSFTLFNIVKSNKRILLFFIENKMITIDETIANILTSSKYLRRNYHLYFLPELKPIIDNQSFEKYFNCIDDYYNIKDLDSEDFKEKRKEGENDSYICQLIQKDSVEEFITYYTKQNISSSQKIPDSLFETNLFLLENKPILIEYAAFFGAIQIFRFLQYDDSNLNPKLWHYAIHSNNPELIHKMEELHIDPIDEQYTNCVIESIKCFHNDFADYLIEHYIGQNENYIDESKYLKYSNFHYITEKIISRKFFIELCKYDYLKFVKLLLSNDIDIALETISKNKSL